MNVAVVGAGMSGLAAARSLHDSGSRVEVFEKARGPGGRMATRRNGDYMFDHGAQYFTVSDPRFRSVVTEWIRDGMVERWFGRIGVNDSGALGPTRTDTDRFVSVPRMSAITRHLSIGLNMAFGSKVDRIRRDRNHWVLEVDGRETEPFDALVITTPPEQAVPLLSESPQLAAIADRVTMLPTWAMMVVFEHLLPVDYDGVFVNKGPLSWVARNSSKPGRPPNETWVMHSSPEWSKENLELEGNEVASTLLPEFFRATGSDYQDPVAVLIHRWRFARAEDPLKEGCLWDNERRLAVAGDWLMGSQVEGAFLSGAAAAGRILAA